jgi:hypothetical protein
MNETFIESAHIYDMTYNLFVFNQSFFFFCLQYMFVSVLIKYIKSAIYLSEVVIFE